MLLYYIATLQKKLAMCRPNVQAVIVNQTNKSWSHTQTFQKYVDINVNIHTSYFFLSTQIYLLDRHSFISRAFRIK